MKRSHAFLILAALLIAATLYYVLAVRFEYGRNQMLQQNLAQKDYTGIYNFYVANRLVLGNRSAIGNPEAMVTIVAVVDFLSNASRDEYAAAIPEIKRLYLDTGQARLLHKYYLTEEELQQKTGRFKYAAAAICFPASQDAVLFHQALFTTPPDRIEELVREQNLSEPTFSDCEAGAAAMLAEDAFETDTFRVMSPSLRIGIQEQDETVLVGNPAFARINRTIREKQVTIGI
jgi:hypothetical protein